MRGAADAMPDHASVRMMIASISPVSHAPVTTRQSSCHQSVCGHSVSAAIAAALASVVSARMSRWQTVSVGDRAEDERRDEAREARERADEAARLHVEAVVLEPIFAARPA